MPLSSTRRSLLVAAIAMAAAMPAGAQVVTVRGTANGLPLPPACHPPAGSPVSLTFSGGALNAAYVCDTTATPPRLAVSCQPTGLGGVGSPIAVQYDVRADQQLSEVFIDCPTAPSTSITNLDVELTRYYPNLDAYLRNAPTTLACRRSAVAASGTVSNPSYDPATRILRYICTVNGTPTEVGCFTWERDVPRGTLGGDARLSYAGDNYTLRAPDCVGFGTPANYAANSPVVVSGALFADSFELDANASTTTITGFNPSQGVAGQPYQVNVSVNSGAGNPSGAVLVSDGTGGNCIVTLAGEGATTTGSCQLPGAGPGGRTVQATYVGKAGILGSTTTGQYNVPLGTQTINWNAPLTNPEPLVYSIGGTATLTATVALSGSGAGGTLTYSVNAGSTACTVSGNTLTVVAATHDVNGSPLASGPTCTVTANAAGNASYDPAAPVVRNIAIRQAAQPITFNPPSPLPRFDPNGTFSVQATRAANSSGQPLTFTSQTTGICTVTGSPTANGNTYTQTVTMTSTRGLCRLRAFQSTGGNPNFVTGQATAEFTIQPGVQNLIYSGPSQIIFANGQTFQVTITGGKSSQPVTLLTLLSPCAISGSPVNSVLTDGRRRVVANIVMNSTGTCSVLAEQNGDADYDAALQEFFINIVP